MLAVQPSAQTFIHNAILFIDTSDNSWYNQVHRANRTSYLSIIAGNGENITFATLLVGGNDKVEISWLEQKFWKTTCFAWLNYLYTTGLWHRGSKATNAWLPQASYPYGNFSEVKLKVLGVGTKHILPVQKS